MPISHEKCLQEYENCKKITVLRLFVSIAYCDTNIIVNHRMNIVAVNTDTCIQSVQCTRNMILLLTVGELNLEQYYFISINELQKFYEDIGP